VFICLSSVVLNFESRKESGKKFCLVQKIGIMVNGSHFLLRFVFCERREGVGLISVLCTIPHKRPRIDLVGEIRLGRGGGRKEGKA